MITGKIINIKGPEKIENRLRSADQIAQGLAVQYSLLLKQNISQNLAQVLGDKSRHLDVSLSGGGFMTIITVQPKDAAGKFMMTGTNPHRITSNRPMPLGDGRFAYSVEHPGTKGKGEEIEAAIRRSILESRAAIAGYPRGI